MNHRFRKTCVLATVLGVTALTAQAESTAPSPPLQPVLPDGRHVVTAGKDSMGRVWPWPWDK